MSKDTLTNRILVFAIAGLVACPLCKGDQDLVRLDGVSRQAVSNLAVAVSSILQGPEGSNAVARLAELVAYYDQSENEGFRPMSLENEMLPFLREDEVHCAAFLGRILLSIERHSPAVQLEIARTFFDNWIGNPATTAGVAEAAERRRRDRVSDVPSVLWWLCGSGAISPVVRKEAWIMLGELAQNGDGKATPYLSGMEEIGNGIREAERRTKERPVPDVPNVSPRHAESTTEPKEVRVLVTSKKNEKQEQGTEMP